MGVYSGMIAKAKVSRIRGFTVIILQRIEVEEGSQSDSMVSSSVLEVVCLCLETMGFATS